jgi:hypothetical protein
MEVVLKINTVAGDHKHYQDGDIIEAFSNTRIHFCHAEMICHPDNFAFNSEGLRDIDTLFEKFMAKTSKYKFTRVSDSEVVRLNLLTAEEDTISDVPNAKSEMMDVSLFLSRRKKHPRHKIFGTLGSEVWYGGNAVRDDVTIANVWNDIETHSANLKADHANWPLSAIEKRVCLPLNCVGWDSVNSLVREISSGTANDRRSPAEREVADPENPGETISETVAKRQWQVPYWDLAVEIGVNIDDVRDINKTVDARSAAPVEQRNHMDDVNLDKVVEGIISL